MGLSFTIFLITVVFFKTYTMLLHSLPLVTENGELAGEG